MLAAMDRALRLMHELVAGEEFAEELTKAQADFFKQVIAPLPGEPIEEFRLASFVEWFIFDRQLAATARTPVEEYLRRHADDLTEEQRLALTGFARNVHSIFQVKKKIADADLLDLYSGKKYRGVKRAPLTLGKGDIADLRLVPVSEEWFATDALVFHPYLARKPILKILKAARKSGEPIDPVLITLMAMNTQYERYPKTAKRNAYEQNSLAKLSRP